MMYKTEIIHANNRDNTVITLIDEAGIEVCYLLDSHDKIKEIFSLVIEKALLYG